MDAVVRLNSALRGRYDVEREIGAGGMATVYLARDIKHGRKVALKVLKSELGAVLGVERFLAEIKVTANLQHPNLLPLFDSGAMDGLLFYVMPFVEGESLRAKLDREKQLPIDEAIRIATAIASALEYAHERGVIHRDLKPENILLQAGQPVIADFGIALAVTSAGAERVTESGISLGTPQYMSPEQAAGDRAVDGRTDIYSLGAVTYEMLVGDPPHVASTSQAIIAKVLMERPPSARALRPSVPEHVEAAIAHALEKLPADRFATARQFADALSGKSIVAAPTMPARDARTGGRRGMREQVLAPVPLAFGVFALAATTVAIWGWMRTTDRPLPRLRFVVDVSDSAAYAGSSGTNIAISPDGSMIAYTGGIPRRIFLRRLDQLDAKPLAGSDNAVGPVFSPDGRAVSFVVDRRRVRVAVDGTHRETMLDSLSGGTIAWGDQSVLLTRTGVGNDGLWRMNPAGGKLELLTKLDRPDAQAIARPDLLPGGRAAVFEFVTKNSVELTELAAYRFGDKEITHLGVLGFNPHYVASGHLVFGRLDGSLGAIAFNPQTLRTSGPQVTVLENVSVQSGGAAEFSVSLTGTLVYVQGAEGSGRLVLVDRSGKSAEMPAPAQPYEHPRFSPDGKRIAVGIRAPGTVASFDIWVYDIASTTLARLTQEGFAARPEWAPDGRHVAWRYQDNVRAALEWQPWDKSAKSELLPYGDSIPGKTSAGLSFSMTGPLYAFSAGPSVKENKIWMSSLVDPKARRILSAPGAFEWSPRISPDGKWLAYVSAVSGRDEVYVRPFPGPGGQFKVSEDGGQEPAWSRGGTELFYRSSTRFVAATIKTAPDPVVVRRDILFSGRLVGSALSSVAHAQYDVSPDGKYFLMVASAALTTGRVMAVQGWLDELRERMNAAAKK